jgi:hypothetical protein
MKEICPISNSEKEIMYEEGPIIVLECGHQIKL